MYDFRNLSVQIQAVEGMYLEVVTVLRTIEAVATHRP